MPEGLPEEGGGGSPPPINAPSPKPNDSAWRDRALRAEARIDDLSKQLDQLRADLNKANTALAESRADADLDRTILTSAAIDTDITRTLIKDAVAKGAKSSAEALKQLQRTKPYLFRTSPPPSSMSPDPPFTGQPQTSLSDLADAARSTNDRRSLLSYLRLKRNS
ncbi:MAG: hypothetical protein KGS45_00835 [Planctomycetes bacterium]|nr:hypothetical protein [Planctomycetota bacterium]